MTLLASRSDGRTRRLAILGALLTLLAALQTSIERRLTPLHTERNPTTATHAATAAGSLQLRADGYGGPILLQIERDPQGCIAQLRVRSHNETADIGAPLLEGDAAWLQRWRGSCPFTAGGAAIGTLDGTTGATLTANALERALGARFAAP